MVFAEEQTQAGATGLRASKEPGDPTWCWQTISYLQRIWESLALDYENYMTTWNEAEEHKVWEKVPYDNPFGTKEEMLRQLAIGDDRQAQRRISVQPIAKRVRLLTHGGDRHSDGFKVTGGNLETPTRGNARDYLLYRLFQDYYPVFERWERGEFRSVKAAAREAGIVDAVPTPVRRVALGADIGRLASALSDHYSPDQFAELNRRMLQLRRQARRH